MKRILFLRSQAYNSTWTNLPKKINELLGDGYEVETAIFSELAFLADGKASRIWHPQAGWDIADFDLVIVCRVGEEIEQATSCAYYLESKHVAFTDRYILKPGKGKLAGAFIRSANGVPVPRTFSGSYEVFEALFKTAPPIGFPLILKADNGRKGQDNYLVHDLAEMLRILKKNTKISMVAQTFIPNDGDMRVLVLCGQIRFAMLRQSGGDVHLNNTSQGGSATALNIAMLSKRVRQDCLRSAALEELQVAGVDVIVDRETGQHYILEVNRAPQIDTGAFPDEKVEIYKDMVLSLLDAAEGKKPLGVIGRAERVEIGELGGKVPARIDTGAKTSAIWASNIRVDQTGTLHFSFFDTTSKYYTGKVITTKRFGETVVSSSTGSVEKRYRVKLHIKLHDRKIYTTFTLANRSTQVYPVLIGRNVLRGKFIVDVKTGAPLYEAERQRTRSLQVELRHLHGKEG